MKDRRFADLAAGEQRLYTLAYTDETGEELFVFAPNGSDLTALEIIPGSDDASPRSGSLSVWQDQAFFIADDEEGDAQLWRSDGQAPERLTGDDGGLVEGERVIPGPGGVYFSYSSESNDCLLGRADADAVVLFPLPALDECLEFNDAGTDTAATDTHFYFVIRTDDEGWELAVADGQNPPRVLDIRPGSSSSDPAWLTAVGPRLLFAANDGVHGPELWMAEGGRVAMLADVRPGPVGSLPERISLRPDGRVAIFSASDPQAWREPHWIDIEQALRVFADRFQSP